MSGVTGVWPPPALEAFAALLGAGPVVVGRLGPLPVYLFGLTAAAGAVAGLLAAAVQARRFGLSGSQLFEAAAPALPAGIVGARLAYVLANFADYRPALAAAANLAEGGFSFYGGLAAGGAVFVFYALRQGWPVGRLLDAAAPGLALGQAVGFVGAHIGGRGTTVPWAVVVDGQLQHPYPAYAMALAYALFFVTWRLGTRRPPVRPGRVFLLYLLLHGLGAAVVGTWAAGRRFLGLTAGQWAGLLAAALAFAALALARGRKTLLDAGAPWPADGAAAVATVGGITVRLIPVGPPARPESPAAAAARRALLAAAWLGALAALLLLFRARL